MALVAELPADIEENTDDKHLPLNVDNFVDSDEDDSGEHHQAEAVDADVAAPELEQQDMWDDGDGEVDRRDAPQ